MALEGETTTFHSGLTPPFILVRVPVEAEVRILWLLELLLLLFTRETRRNSHFEVKSRMDLD